MKDEKLYKNINEDITAVNKNVLINRVFENKIKNNLSNVLMADGGDVSSSSVYTPYEFLHELMPKVYGRKYIVSDEVAKKYEDEIKKEQSELDAYVFDKIQERGVTSIYELPDSLIVEEIEIRKRKLTSKKAFISESELQAYLFCHPELDSNHYVEKTNFDKDKFIEDGLIMADYNINDGVHFVYRYDYLSGNLYKKISILTEEYGKFISEGISNEQIEKQKAVLNEFKPKQAKITLDNYNRIYIHPNSKFAEHVFTVGIADWNNIDASRDMSLMRAWEYWTETEMDSTELKNIESTRALHKYYTELFRPSAGEESREFVNSRRRAFEDGDRLFNKFLNEALNETCKSRLQYQWNELYNNLTQQLYYKIPVALSLSKLFKNDKEFIPNETQVQSVPYIKDAGSGLLAYGVGVGKTASSIMNVSYSFDNGLCKKAIFTVPNATYDKWIKEVKGGEEIIHVVSYKEDGKTLTSEFLDISKARKFSSEVKGEISEKRVSVKGLLPHVNVVSLYNLNADIVKNQLKDYSDGDLREMNMIDELMEYLNTLDKSYRFNDSGINSKIRELYKGFSVEKAMQSDLTSFKRIITDYKKELIYNSGSIKKFEDKTIFFMTFEGLKYLGLKTDQEIDSLNNDSLLGKLFNEFTQGEDIANYTEREIRSVNANTLKDVIYGSESGIKLNLEEFGFDYAVFDEAHYFKKIYTESKGEIKSKYVTGFGTYDRHKRKYNIGAGEKATKLSLSAWFLTRYIQENNNGNNTIQLTATPFTNKPAEIYSMLALTNYKKLVNSGYKYMQEFFDNFMSISFEFILTTSQKILQKEVLNGFNNLPQMRTLIYGIMDYKSGEDANIKRPEKIMYPSYLVGRDTTLPATLEQEKMFASIKSYIRGEIAYDSLCGIEDAEVDVYELDDTQLLDYIIRYGSESQKEKWGSIETPLNIEDKNSLIGIVNKLIEKEDSESIGEDDINDDNEKAFVKILKGISMLKQVTLSPYLSTCQKEKGNEPNYIEYVESSPKIQYALGCIKSIHEYEKANGLKKSGIVIYMNTGVHPSFRNYKWREGGFEKIKNYLIHELGYDPNEISLVSGQISPIQKEKEKNKFLAGQSTVLIGSSAISTGVDLQNNCSCLINLTLDWNPTEQEQIDGRIHRQGNRFANVRISLPMIINSADPVIFQSQTEKANRIKSIWNKDERGTTLDLKEFDANKFKKQLLDDPKDKLSFWLEEAKTDLEDEKIILQNRLESFLYSSETFDTVEDYTPVMKGVLTVIDAFKKDKKRKEGIASFEDKRNEIIDKMGDDDVALARELSKLKKETYDYKNDPDGRYIYDDYSELSHEELLVKVNSQIQNTDSWYRTYMEGGTYSERRGEILNQFFKENFPRWYEGYWTNNEDPKYISVDFDSRYNLEHKVNRWKGALKDYKKLKEKLLILNIDVTNLEETKLSIRDKIQQIDTELENIDNQKDEKLKEFMLEMEQRKNISPTIEERVVEFSEMNHILHDTLVTFKIDEAKVVDVPKQLLNIVEETSEKPKVKKIPAPRKEVVVKTNEDEFLKDKIQSFKDLLELEEDENEITFLKDKIDSFQDLLELEMV